MIAAFFEIRTEINLDSDKANFFEELIGLTIWEQPIITEELVRNTFDIFRLIKQQRLHVERLRDSADEWLEEAQIHAERFNTAGLSEDIPFLKDNPELFTMVRAVAAGSMPRLNLLARLKRYSAYLSYLKDLVETYASEIEPVDMCAFRSRFAGGNSTES